MRLRTWCRIGVIFLVKLLLKLVHGDCVLRQIQLGSARFHFIIASDALVLMNSIVSCSVMMTASKLAQSF